MSILATTKDKALMLELLDLLESAGWAHHLHSFRTLRGYVDDPEFGTYQAILWDKGRFDWGHGGPHIEVTENLTPEDLHSLFPNSYG